MTNNEILQANLLDLIFNNRNKEYGAYALRRSYNSRLFTAIAAAMSAILVFIFINALGKKNEMSLPVIKEKGGIVIKTIELPKQAIKPEVKQISKPKPVVKMAATQYVNKIEIKPDDKVKIITPDIAKLDGKVISTVTTDGKLADGKPVTDSKPQTDGGAGNNVVMAKPEPDFVVQERDPEFPGGAEALKRFLSINLSTPGDLDLGEKKMVRIKFKVDKDGTISTLEIINTGGADFDKEVMRVCKKMPRWKPALQNGINVSVSYVLPVTFIGAEQ